MAPVKRLNFKVGNQFDFKQNLSCWEWLKDYLNKDPYLIGWRWKELIQEMQEVHHWVAVDPEGKVLALVLYRSLSVDLFEISFLATHPAKRRRGVMRQLLLAFQADLKAQDKVWLEVHENNLPAQSLYISLGWVRHGFRPHYYSDGHGAHLFSYEKP